MAAFRNLLRRTPAYREFLAPWQEPLEKALEAQTWQQARQDTPEEAIHLFAMDQLYAHVHQQGFAALFDSSADALVDDARDGFSAVGLPGIAATISRALSKKTSEEAPDFTKENDEFYRAAHTYRILGHPKYVPFANAYALQARQRLEGQVK